jgi:hypothetical protein
MTINIHTSTAYASNKRHMNSHQNSRHTQPSFDGLFHNLMENAKLK